MLRNGLFVRSVILVAGVFISGPVVSADLDPARVGWHRLEMQASKFFMSVNTSAELQIVDQEDVSEVLTGAGQGEPVPAAGEVARLRYQLQGLGRNSLTTLHLDADRGSALQREQEDSGRKLRHRIYRFTDVGAYHYTRYPAKGEEGLPKSQWTDNTQGFRPYPDGAVGHVVTDPTALLYVAAAGALVDTGDEISILTFARRKVARVDLKLVGTESVKVDYQRDQQQFQGTVSALRVLVDPDPLEGGDDDDFEFLGLRRDIELLIDPDTRIPLQLKGHAPVVGLVTFRLESAGTGRPPSVLGR